MSDDVTQNVSGNVSGRVMTPARLLAEDRDSINRLAGQVAALREALVYACASGTEEILADTEATAREHDQRLRLEGARELVRRYEDALAHTIAPTSVLKRVLADMEAEEA